MNILALADLHGRLPKKMPKSLLASRIDLLVAAGDICPNFPVNWSRLESGFRKVDIAKEAPAQLEWFQSQFLGWTRHFQQVKNIIFVYGNHDFILVDAIEGVIVQRTGSRVIEVDGKKIGLLAGSMPLIGEWSDEVDEYEMNQRILAMDPDIELLISHVPPMGIMDQAYNGDLIGCRALRDAIFGVTSFGQVIAEPRFNKLTHHWFGHCHETRGLQEHVINSRTVTFHNVAEKYETQVI